MKSSLKFTFAIAAFTACAILLCQLYWVYNNYRTGKASFDRMATYALEKSIDAYQLAQNALPTSLDYKAPTLTVFMRTIPNQDPIALDTPTTIRRFHTEFATVSVDKSHLSAVRSLIANLLSQQKHRPLNLDTLNNIYNKQLANNGITDKFALSIVKNQTIVRPGEMAAVVNFYKSPVVVKAVLLHPVSYAFRHNFIPALISFLLILLSAGSLFYMWTIIRRQMLLDSMKNDFINNITHELRTPLSILKSSNEALSSFGAADDPGSLKRHLRINAMVLNNLDLSIDRILDFSKAEQGILVPEYEQVNLPALVFQVAEQFSVKDDVKIEVIYELTSAEVMTDGFMINTILSNLLDNSLKYARNKPQISIKISPLRHGWCLRVSDNGIGIAKEHFSLIFDKFYRTQTGDLHEVKGYGLGLAYVKQLVLSLNGDITVKSELGTGSVFTIEFPG